MYTWGRLVVDVGGLGDAEPLDEQRQQLAGLAEGAVGGEEGAHERQVGVHVVREALHQLEQRGALDERHERGAAHGRLLQQDVVRRVGLREPVQARRGQPQRVPPLQLRQDALEEPVQHGLGVEHDEVAHPVPLVGRRRARQHHRAAHARGQLQQVSRLVRVGPVHDLQLPDVQLLLELELHGAHPAGAAPAVHRHLHGQVAQRSVVHSEVRQRATGCRMETDQAGGGLAQQQQPVEQVGPPLGHLLAGPYLRQYVFCNTISGVREK